MWYLFLSQFLDVRVLEVEGLLGCIRINVVFISLPIQGCQSIGGGRLIMSYKNNVVQSTLFIMTVFVPSYL